MLYAITEAGLEIYTARGAAAAIHEITEFDGITNVSLLRYPRVGTFGTNLELIQSSAVK